jgi:hypothetical protein
MIATDAPQWPSDPGSHSGIILEFGRTRADLLQWALGTADPLADAVVEEMHELGRGCVRSGTRVFMTDSTR